MRLRPFLFSRAHLRTSGMAAATAARSPTIAVRSSTMHAASSTGTTSLRRGWRCLVRGCRWAAGDSIRAGAASPSPVHKSPPCTVDHRGASRGVSRRGLRSNRGGGHILRPLPVHWKTRDFLHCPMGEIARFPMESPARIIKKIPPGPATNRAGGCIMVGVRPGRGCNLWPRAPRGTISRRLPYGSSIARPGGHSR